MHMTGRQWYVVCVAPRMEYRVETALSMAGFGCWFPKERVVKIKQGKGWRRRSTIHRPLFPGYVFSAFDMSRDEWQRIIDIDGVHRVLDNNGLPSTVSSEFIETLQRAEFNGAFDRDKLPKHGEEMRVIGGPFDGFVGKVQRAMSGGRIKLLVRLLDRMVSGEFPLVGLERTA